MRSYNRAISSICLLSSSWISGIGGSGFGRSIQSLEYWRRLSTSRTEVRYCSSFCWSAAPSVCCSALAESLHASSALARLEIYSRSFSLRSAVVLWNSALKSSAGLQTGGTCTPDLVQHMSVPPPIPELITENRVRLPTCSAAA